jgi:hypothetical protein
MFKLRDYQITLADECHLILSKKNLVYLAAEVRTGKTLTSLEVGKLGGYKNILFLTKKKAIGEWHDFNDERNNGIVGDYMDFGYDKHFKLTVINDESMHKLDDNYDFIIHDEHHRFGSSPKPGKATKLFKLKYSRMPQMYLSGTISPETYSQLYHQFWVSINSPWSKYTNFYKWARDYVNVKPKHIRGAHTVNDYTDARKELILTDIAPYIVTFTQEQAGFKTKVIEHILEVDMSPMTYRMCDKLLRDLVIEGKEEVILADTPAKLQQKLHQMYSGTIKFESGNRLVFDTSKADFIKEKFKGKKIAIFYKFIGELECLQQVFGDKLTNDIPEFNADPDKWFVSQIISGREGTNLSAADYIVFFNIDFSAVSYFQAKDRMTTIDRPVNEIFWLMARKGIEHKIYKSVVKKKTYTVSIFKRDFKVKS